MTNLILRSLYYFNRLIGAGRMVHLDRDMNTGCDRIEICLENLAKTHQD